MDLTKVAPGKLMVIDWEGEKVFVLRRTSEQIEWLKTYNPPQFPDYGKDELFSPVLNNRFRSFQEKYLVISIDTRFHNKKIFLNETPNFFYSCEEFIYSPEKLHVAKTVAFPGGFYCASMYGSAITASGLHEYSFAYDPAGRSAVDWIMPLHIPYHRLEGDKLTLGKRN